MANFWRQNNIKNVDPSDSWRIKGDLKEAAQTQQREKQVDWYHVCACLGVTKMNVHEILLSIWAIISHTKNEIVFSDMLTEVPLESVRITRLHWRAEFGPESLVRTLCWNPTENRGFQRTMRIKLMQHTQRFTLTGAHQILRHSKTPFVKIKIFTRLTHHSHRGFFLLKQTEAALKTVAMKLNESLEGQNCLRFSDLYRRECQLTTISHGKRNWKKNFNTATVHMVHVFIGAWNVFKSCPVLS